MLNEIDVLIDDKKVDQELLNKKVKVSNSLQELEKLEAMEIAQKDGSWIDDPYSVKNELFTHFKERQHGNCGIDKSPGPDGFTFGFYRRYWDTIEKEVVEAVSYFLKEGNFPKGGNASFIALIHKKKDAKVVNDYRSICLIGSLYKIISKILANRLMGVLGDLVNEFESAFISNRQILDGPFILDELIHWCKYKKRQTMIFKVDFEKAYDSVRWDYLDDVLQKFGFGSKWRQWIQNCLHSSKGSILVNGSPTWVF
nr:RNA-directed DNA polymerase, eukaryota, reverse transcriptase zinc-binding domain protein [Tanacetum cinerariifolium]